MLKCIICFGIDDDANEWIKDHPTCGKLEYEFHPHTKMLLKVHGFGYPTAEAGYIERIDVGPELEEMYKAAVR